MNGRRSAAFTLLEVMLSVVIMALVGLSIYQFVELNVRAVLLSTETASREMEMHGLIAILQSQMNTMQPTQRGALSGQSHIFNNAASDEMTWLAEAGNGLLTKDATGEYNVTLMLRPAKDGGSGNRLELGLSREPTTEAAAAADSTATATQPTAPESWVHLMDNVAAVEIRYFDSQLNDWVQKWTDRTRHPVLLRIRIWRSSEDNPFEAVLTVPLSKLPG